MSDHPIWQLHDFRKTVRLNWRFYQRELRQWRRWNNISEFVIAATASGSAIAGLTVLWQDGAGKNVWLGLSILAAVLSTLKPILKTSKRIETLVKVTKEYAMLDGQCESLAMDCEHNQTYADRHYQHLKKMMKKRNELKATMADEKVNSTVIEELQDQVNRELPADQLYVPQELGP